MAQPVPTKAFLQLAKTAAMCQACHESPPIPPFLLAQNLSSKRIVPTDNMRPKLHDEYTCHEQLKGQKTEITPGDKLFHDIQKKELYSLNDCECDIGMGLEWSGNETHQEVRVVKVEKLVHEVEDAQPQLRKVL